MVILNNKMFFFRRQSAEKSENLNRYERLMQRITDLKKNNEVF